MGVRGNVVLMLDAMGFAWACRLQAVVGGEEHDVANVKSMMADSTGDWPILGPPLLRAVELFVHSLATGTIVWVHLL